MFDFIQSPPRGSLTKPAIICAVGAGIGFGTCGIGVLVDSNAASPYLTGFGMLIFFAGLFGLLIIGLIALLRAIVDAFNK